MLLPIVIVMAKRETAIIYAVYSGKDLNGNNYLILMLLNLGSIAWYKTKGENLNGNNFHM